MHSANLYLRIWNRIVLHGYKAIGSTVNIAAMIWNRIVLHGYKAIAMIQISSKEIWNRIVLHGYKAGVINDLSRFEENRTEQIGADLELGWFTRHERYI